MATNVQKIIASAGGRYLTITPANAGILTECVLVGLDGDTVLFRYPVGATAQEVDLELIGDCFFICVQGEYSYTRSATSEVAVGGDLTIAGTLKEILIELKKKLSNLHLSIMGLKNISDAQAGEINDLEVQVGAIEAQIATIQNGIVALESASSGHTVALGQLTDSIVALEALTDGYKAGLQADVDTLEATVAGHATSIASVASEVDALQTLTATLSSNIQATVDALSSTVSGHTSTLSTQAGKISALEGTASNHGTRLGTAEADITALENLLASHIADVGEMQTQLDTLAGTVNDLVLGGNETETAAALQALQDSDSALSVRVSAVETGLTGKAPVSHTHSYAPPVLAFTQTGQNQTLPTMQVGQMLMLNGGSTWYIRFPSGGSFTVLSSDLNKTGKMYAGGEAYTPNGIEVVIRML